jgi:hypothetical protein
MKTLLLATALGAALLAGAGVLQASAHASPEAARAFPAPVTVDRV